jgi:hypothetical protein
MPSTLVRCNCIAIGIVVSSWTSALAGDVCCAKCGCTTGCRTICRLVCEEKEVEVVCWGCKREEFCIPGPSKPAREHCECVCGTCNEGDKPSAVYAKPKRFVWLDWFPGYAQVYKRTKLMRKSVKVAVPSQKWVTEHLCPECQACWDDTVDDGSEALPHPAR